MERGGRIPLVSLISFLRNDSADDDLGGLNVTNGRFPRLFHPFHSEEMKQAQPKWHGLWLRADITIDDSQTLVIKNDSLYRNIFFILYPPSFYLPYYSILHKVHVPILKVTEMLPQIEARNPSSVLVHRQDLPSQSAASSRIPRAQRQDTVKERRAGKRSVAPCSIQ